MKVKVRCSRFECREDIHFKTHPGPVGKNATPTPRPPAGNWIQRVQVQFPAKGLGIAFFATGPGWVLKCISSWLGLQRYIAIFLHMIRLLIFGTRYRYLQYIYILITNITNTSTNTNKCLTSQYSMTFPFPIRICNDQLTFDTHNNLLIMYVPCGQYDTSMIHFMFVF